MKILILDYGMGNISSLVNAFKYLDIHDVLVSSRADDLRKSDRLILPGVGNFSTAARKALDIKLDEALSEEVLIRKKPILGVCLGMQLLGLSSTEGGSNVGLGFVSGSVDKFQTNSLRVPHVGYNQVKPHASSRLYQGLGNDPDFYFTHSYRMLSEEDIGQSLTLYGEEFIASFEIDNIAGVQFHPELSQTNGLKLLNNFIELF
ncbi:imidazole glycerol phosphate synthase subunit HisH [Vibrio cidicii]|uniref:imidazole glycerol phosphate synthase subunit HisH n=1 Tax=Vibrio cidicii TaxID=1763883 RepID=UPI0018C1E8B9|nr:imidazole glycerol phosphate synthase subunit HisH [Vibrio cidicii]ELV8627085.1 imidazole glycerol phosphate synthase subunit HisH [Vibrio cidicii]MBG0757362.1 imidazole glycerol phosphate synthase subunit HisH [Vibrio cidicii]